MALELLESLSLAGEAGKPNEDAFGAEGFAAVVLDGATPLGESIMPGKSDAAWIAQFGARRILAHLRDGEGARKALRGALADTEKSFYALRLRDLTDIWQTPCASMMLVCEAGTGQPPPHARSALEGEVAAAGRAPAPVASESRRGSELEFLWFGDCAALLKQGDNTVTVIGDVFDRKANESDAARRLAAASNRPGNAAGIFPRCAARTPQHHQYRR